MTRNSDSLSSRSKIFNAFVEKQRGEINGIPLYKNDSTLLIQNDSVFNKMIEFNNEYVPVILEEFANDYFEINNSIINCYYHMSTVATPKEKFKNSNFYWNVDRIDRFTSWTYLDIRSYRNI